MSDKLRVDLQGAPQTMLATLYARALDANAPDSILDDRWARDIVDRIDYDWSATTITARNSPSVTLRSAHFDQWARLFLDAHPNAVVLHLGCGLDSRYFRLRPGDVMDWHAVDWRGVDWYDVDYPNVIGLREKFYPTNPGYHHVAASVTDPGWLAEIPTDRPTLILAEGLTMYLTQTDGFALLRRVVDRFPSGEMQFDAFSRLGIKAQWMNAVVRRSGATLHWGIDGPDEILDAVPKSRLLQWVPVFESSSLSRVGGVYPVVAAVMNRVPGLRSMAQFHRYSY